MNIESVSKKPVGNAINTLLPAVFSCLRQDLVAGNYAINITNNYLWRVNADDAITINLGAQNGKTNVHAIICNSCKSRKASHDYNGTDDYLCKKCYDTRNGR